MISPEEMLVYGGCLSGGFSGGPCPSQDSWLFSYTKNKWEQVDSSCISPRSFGAMASLVSDGYRQAAVLFSGLEKDRTVLKVDEEKEDEVALYDSLSKRWAKKRVQGFYFPEKRNGHVMCTGLFKNELGAFMFGGYGHHSDSNMADLWFLRVNITTAFENPMLTAAYPSPLVSETCSNFFTTIHLHAILMFAGWAVFLNVGTLIARYGDSKNESRHKLVKRVYRVLQVGINCFIQVAVVL